MSIVTKSGDRGETSLFGGLRVHKSHDRLEAYGTVDELNASLGLVMAALPKDSELLEQCISLQHDLFVLGAELATPIEQKKYSKKGPNAEPLRNEIKKEHIDGLERMVIALESQLPPMRFFILPSGSETIARLHMARTICRRAERRVALLHKHGEVRSEPLVYLNRLSDLLFLFARQQAKIEGIVETKW